jgi:hypothetical protein
MIPFFAQVLGTEIVKMDSHVWTEGEQEVIDAQRRFKKQIQVVFFNEYASMFSLSLSEI